MSQEEQNKNVVRGFYDLLFSGKLEDARPLFSQSFVLHEPRGLPYGGEYRGFDGVLDIARKVTDAWVDLDVKMGELLAGGDRVASRMVLSGTDPRTRRSWTMPFMEEFRFEDGKIAEMTIWYHDPSRVAWAADFVRKYE